MKGLLYRLRMARVARLKEAARLTISVEVGVRLVRRACRVESRARRGRV